MWYPSWCPNLNYVPFLVPKWVSIATSTSRFESSNICTYILKLLVDFCQYKPSFCIHIYRCTWHYATPFHQSCHSRSYTNTLLPNDFPSAYITPFIGRGINSIVGSQHVEQTLSRAVVPDLARFPLLLPRYLKRPIHHLQVDLKVIALTQRSHPANAEREIHFNANPGHASVKHSNSSRSALAKQ